MSNTAFPLEQATHEGLKPVSFDDVPERIVKHGEVFVARGMLQKVGAFEALMDATYKVIEQRLGAERLAKIKEIGLGRLHEVVDSAELVEVNDALFQVVPTFAGGVLKRVGQQILGIDGTFYIETLPNARIIVPWDKWFADREFFKNFEAKRGPGKLTVHGPHHDSWYHHPLNCINVWTAIAPVYPGNGLSIWPDVWGKRLPFDKDGNVRKDQYYGRPLNFHLEPGDAVMFAAEHLHGSEINQLTATRYVVSMRMTPEKPNYFADAKYNYVPVEQARDILDPNRNRLLETVEDNITRIKKAVAVRLRPGTAAKPRGDDHTIAWHARIPPLDDVSADFPATIPATIDSQTGAMSFAASELEEGQIRPLSKQVVAARIDGQIFAVGRYCPHAYADLAGGYVQDGKITCPWHNLGFDLASGACACSSVKSILSYPVEMQGDQAVVHVSRATREAA